MATSRHHKFIGAVAALAILITGLGAAQARAQQQTYAAEQALAALLGLAVIGAIIANDTDHKPKAHHVAPVVKPAPKPKALQARPLPRDVARHRDAGRRALPEQCLRQARTDRGTARFFGARCMNRNYDYVRRLPDRCERRFRTDRGVRFGWGARCLRRDGYRLARH